MLTLLNPHPHPPPTTTSMHATVNADGQAVAVAVPAVPIVPVAPAVVVTSLPLHCYLHYNSTTAGVYSMVRMMKQVLVFERNRER